MLVKIPPLMWMLDAEENIKAIVMRNLAYSGGSYILAFIVKFDGKAKDL